jgi:hypothetical protein
MDQSSRSVASKHPVTWTSSIPLLGAGRRAAKLHSQVVATKGGAVANSFVEEDEGMSSVSSRIRSVVVLVSVIASVTMAAVEEGDSSKGLVGVGVVSSMVCMDEDVVPDSRRESSERG